MLALLLSLVIGPALAQTADTDLPREPEPPSIDEIADRLSELEQLIEEELRIPTEGPREEPAPLDTGIGAVLDPQCSVEPDSEPAHDGDEYAVREEGQR